MNCIPIGNLGLTYEDIKIDSLDSRLYQAFSPELDHEFDGSILGIPTLRNRVHALIECISLSRAAGKSAFCHTAYGRITLERNERGAWTLLQIPGDPNAPDIE